MACPLNWWELIPGMRCGLQRAFARTCLLASPLLASNASVTRKCSCCQVFSQQDPRNTFPEQHEVRRSHPQGIVRRLMCFPSGTNTFQETLEPMTKDRYDGASSIHAEDHDGCSTESSLFAPNAWHVVPYYTPQQHSSRGQQKWQHCRVCGWDLRADLRMVHH